METRRVVYEGVCVEGRKQDLYEGGPASRGEEEEEEEEEEKEEEEGEEEEEEKVLVFVEFRRLTSVSLGVCFF
ncbi:hypothetical protein E2C01_067507 [Portunus trituberculatus]|uniref:Uncharacterized protein n=1 Tax=Portunus trituberculatus TaxID=210409 RepID=A0A5B7HWW8_PORTR|nr:hypothetical protein [Portunus trituberculatus]